MFSLTYSTPSKIHGTIKVSEPIYHLGPVTDIYKKQWSIHGIFGNNGKFMVQACPMGSLHPYYTDTSINNNYGIVHQEWHPYSVEVVQPK